MTESQEASDASSRRSAIIILFLFVFALHPIVDFQKAIGQSGSDLLQGLKSESFYSSFTAGYSFNTAAGAAGSGVVQAHVTSTSDGAGICHPCIVKYIETIKGLGILGNNDAKSSSSMGKKSVIEEWEDMLCQSQSPAKLVSTRPLILGVGPGTTATRSFGLAIQLLRRSVLHYKVLRDRYSNEVRDWGANNQYFHVDQLADAAVHSHKDWVEAVDDVDFASMFQDVDAVFDFPFYFYALDILRAFPNAKIVMTHRDPRTWYRRRQEFCKPQTNTDPRICASPFILRPWNISLFDEQVTRDNAIESFLATEEVLKCLVGPDRYLQVDAWNPPEDGWLPYIARFIGAPVPPPEKCAVPRSATHGLDCPQNDEDCRQCSHYTIEYRKDYLPPY